VGDTNSPDFPLTNWTVKPQQGNPGVHDGFVMKFITDCRAIGYSTLFGGDKGGEQALGVTTSLGEPVVVGYTGSTDFPVANDAVQTSFGGFIDSFMVKIGSDGRKISYATYMGGNTFDEAKLISPVRPRFPTIDSIFFTAGETMSESIHDNDPGTRGSSDVFIVRWRDTRQIDPNP
jgi:hypothetical protein